MMNKRIRSMIDEIFAEMKMTAENLALRDELMANAQARYEDAVAQGKTEEEAFAEVAASLGDVQSLLSEMNGEPEASAQEEPAGECAEQAEAQEEEKAEASSAQETFDLENTLNKAFAALGDLGRSVMPQAKKLVREMDNATGGMIKDMGRAVNRGMRDAQRAAGEAIDRRNRGEETVQNPEESAQPQDGRSAEDLRQEAADLRAQASIKEVSGDAESADELRAQADELETRAEAMEQAAAMEEARHMAEQAADPAEGAGAGDFAQSVDDIVREAEKLAGEEDGRADDTIRRSPEEAEPVENMRVTRRFPVAGLRSIDVKLDADDVVIEPVSGLEIEVCWEAEAALSVPDVRMDAHALVVRRANPDVFKTFFSVFKKDGGRITLRVPRGYAADYSVTTTSGDILLRDVDADDVTAGSTSGNVRVEPEAAVRARKISVNTVSGSATVSARAEEIDVNTVSGRQFVSCDADKADINAVSGSVHLEGACDEWEVNAVSSNVELMCTLVPSRKISLSTISGGVRVALPGEVRGFVADVSGMSGSIVNEFGPNRYGTCALPIHMDTMSGRLTITRL